MTSIPSYPPHIHHPPSSSSSSSSSPPPPFSSSLSHNPGFEISSSLPTTAAYAFLAAFLRRANLDPAFRPDSTLTERGPQSNSSAGNPSLTLHHLQRIRLGLEGVKLGLEDLEEGRGLFREGRRIRRGNDDHGKDQDGSVAGQRKRKWGERSEGESPGSRGTGMMPTVLSTAGDGGLQDTNTNDTAAGAGWQDREDFELAQDDADVDVNNAQRDPAGVMTSASGDIMQEELGQVVHAHEDVGRGEQVVQSEGGGESPVERRKMTREEKAERKRQKELRSKETKQTVSQGKRPEVLEEQPKTVNSLEPSETPKKRKKKRKSTIEE